MLSSIAQFDKFPDFSSNLNLLFEKLMVLAIGSKLGYFLSLYGVKPPECRRGLNAFSFLRDTSGITILPPSLGKYVSFSRNSAGAWTKLSGTYTLDLDSKLPILEWPSWGYSNESWLSLLLLVSAFPTGERSVFLDRNPPPVKTARLSTWAEGLWNFSTFMLIIPLDISGFFELPNLDWFIFRCALLVWIFLKCLWAFSAKFCIV